MNRRSFLTGLIGGAGALAVSPRAVAEDAVFHVLYPGSTTPEQAEELLAQIASLLGPDVAKRLKVVAHDGAQVVVFDRTGLKTAGDRAAAQAVASRHDELLRAVLDEQRTFAVVVASSTVDSTWNVRYGLPSPEPAAKRVWSDVSRMLGPGVTKALVVETTPDGRFQVVYRRRGDRTSTSQVAVHHGRLLRSLGLAVEPVPDGFGALAFDATTAPDEALDVPSVDALLAEDLPVDVAARVEAAADDVPTARAEIEPADVEVPEAELEAEAELAEAADTAEPDTLETPQTPAAPHPPPARYDGRASLQSLVNRRVQEHRSAGRVSSVERTAWLVHDLVADRTLCAIHADEPYQAASMIKPFVALAFFHLVNKGKLAYGDASRVHLERMIRDSSNPSTNWFIQQVGGPSTCQALLRKHYGAICADVEIVEYIPSSGCTYRNRASARDHARLLTAMWRDELPYARELRRVMNLPGPDRLYFNVPDIPAGTEVYNKTGTTAMCLGDMGVLVARTKAGQRVPYIVVGVIERADRTSRYTSWSQVRANVVRDVSGLVYRYLRDVYDLA